MVLSTEVQRKWHGFLAAATWVLMVQVVLLVVTGTGRAAGEPKTVAEIALYQGSDRQKILVEGAKKEGMLLIYTSNTATTVGVGKEFEKKYPFIKVMGWRSGSKQVIQRTMQEYAAGRFLVDIIETSEGPMMLLHKEGLFQEFYSPESDNYEDGMKKRGKVGVYYLADRSSPNSLGFNTRLISPDEAPKTLKDLLNPRWKGKMAFAGGSSAAARWVGNALEVEGREYLEKYSRQDVRVMNVSGGAMVTLIAAGEIPLSPNASGETTVRELKKGAPVAWRPLEPVVTNLGLSGMSIKTPHPFAALLFLDYVHSEEGQKVVEQNGPTPAREIGDSFLGYKFKKNYISSKYPIEEYEKKEREWENLIKQLFIYKKR